MADQSQNGQQSPSKQSSKTMNMEKNSLKEETMKQELKKVLQAKKALHLVHIAKYGRFQLCDPFMALERDSEAVNETTFDDPQMIAFYDNQLTQLENLITQQKKQAEMMQSQMREVEKRYKQAVTELDEEKRKHAQDTAQGDDVTYLLEKEREKLKQEVQFQKTQNKKLEKEMKRYLLSMEEERHQLKRMVVHLVEERKKLLNSLIEEKKANRQLIGQMREMQRQWDTSQPGGEGHLGDGSGREMCVEMDLIEISLNKTMIDRSIQSSPIFNDKVPIPVIVSPVSSSVGSSPPMASMSSPSSNSSSPVTVQFERRVQQENRYVRSLEKDIERLQNYIEEMQRSVRMPDASADMGDPRAFDSVLPVDGRVEARSNGVNLLPTNSVPSASPVQRLSRNTPPPIPPNKPVLDPSSFIKPRLSRPEFFSRSSIGTGQLGSSRIPPLSSLGRSESSKY